MSVTGSAFRFRLERVRAIRERGEQRAQRDLAQALARRADAEAELHVSDAQLAQAHAEQRSFAGDASEVGGGELLARQLFSERLEQQRETQTQHLQQRDAEVAERDAALAVAATEREMLERLRERRRGEHERELAARERDELDEMAAVRFRARREEESSA